MHTPMLTAMPLRESSPAGRALRRLWRRKGAIVGLAVVLGFVVLAVFAPLLATRILEAPSAIAPVPVFKVKLPPKVKLPFQFWTLL